ncbi:hypothetical protein HII17_12245 [Thalassotalea sp. M1531]|uniref:Porin n=1 Tax=Thalassotalea algicola TaxID=2716224 RepID=A0A7Y0LDR7_9GAMM|nr:hypothetical protein [Thalassotalea algicola]NMP32333.1 hypothetical protein [Thalassotalea algicola]
MNAVKYTLLLILITYTLVTVSQELADDWPVADEQWQEDWETDDSPWSLAGYTEVSFGSFLQSNIVQSELSLSEIRLRLDAGYSHDYFEFSAIGDLLFDDIDSGFEWQTRELNVALSPLNNVDLKIGRQLITWGTGDYIFLNDLFPKSWVSFFSGRDDEFLKLASDSARATWYLKDITIDLAYTPNFVPDDYLTGKRFSFFSEKYNAQIAPDNNFFKTTTNNETYSLRVTSSYQGVEYAIYGYKGYWNSPLGFNEQGQAYFPTLHSYGASIRSSIGSGLINAEFSVYNSIEDISGDQLNIANDQIRLLIGYEQELIKNITGGFQFYVEQTLDYQEYIQNSFNPDLVVDEYRQMFTFRLTHLSMQQKLKTSLFTFISPSDNDGYLKASMNYRYNDSWSIASGTNWFFGDKAHTFWSQHKDNSNVWIRAKFNF